MNRTGGLGEACGLHLRRRGEVPETSGNVSDHSPERVHAHLKPGTRVVLYSERLDRELTVELTHVDTDRLGGNLVEDPEDPLIQRGDHLHFRRCNVLRRDG